jgi:hypothetical protein
MYTACTRHYEKHRGQTDNQPDLSISAGQDFEYRVYAEAGAGGTT